MSEASMIHGRNKKCILSFTQEMWSEENMTDEGIDGRIMLKLILKKYSMRMWTELINLRIVPVEGPCEHGNEPLGSVKGRDFLG
jgi:hypothetical protein